MNIYETKRVISCILNVDDDISLEYVEDKMPSYVPHEKRIQIVKELYWNEVYQLSHELLHAAFYKYNGCMPCEYLWIEEIVCEAFSIYCIEKYCHSEKIYWFGYLSQNYYILNGNVSEPEKIKTIKELNGKLGGFKENGVRQFIHPYALDIKNIINEDFDQLEEFLNYRKYIQDGKIEIDATNRIAIKIFSLQEKLQ